MVVLIEFRIDLADIRSGNMCFQVEEGYRKNEESHMAKCLREALAQLSQLVESSLQTNARYTCLSMAQQQSFNLLRISSASRVVSMYCT